MIRPTLRSTWSLAALVGLLAAAGTSADAALVTYNFSGSVTSLADPTGLLGGAVHLGDTYTGTLIFDSATKPGVSQPNRAIYNYDTYNSPSRNFLSPIGMILHVGSLTIQPDYQTSTMSVSIFNDAATTAGGIADGFIAQQNSYLNFNQGVSSVISLIDRTSSAFSSTALPTSVASSSFTDGNFQFLNQSTLSPTAPVLFQGTINGLNPNATVPEPASAALLAAGLLGAWGIRRRRGRREAAAAARA